MKKIITAILLLAAFNAYGACICMHPVGSINGPCQWICSGSPY